MAFDKLEPLFVAKYGPPDKTGIEKIKSVMGVEYQSREEKWMRGSVLLTFSERGGEGKVDQMAIVILTSEYLSFADRMKKKDVEDAGKRL